MAKKILIVDDDPDFVDATKSLLEAKGYAVETAGSGKEGYETALANKFDLMILDVMMAYDSDGFDTARKLHQNDSTKNVPILMITGIRKAKNLPFGFEPDDDWLPVKNVLEKPVKPDVLIKAVEDNIGTKA